MRTTVEEHLQADTDDAPVLGRPAPLRRLRDSGPGYKYPDLLTTSNEVVRLSDNLGSDIFNQIV